jgi:hypothetical protein
VIASSNGYQSDGSTLIFLTQTGVAVSPIPDKHVVSLSGGTLTDRVYAGTGGTAPDWTFASTPSVRQLATGVGQAMIGDPPTPVPLFQYYAYQGAQLSATPLPTPLSDADAARTVAVAVSFSIAPGSNPARDDNAPATVTDKVVMRLSPASEAATEVNPPCA